MPQRDRDTLLADPSAAFMLDGDPWLSTILGQNAFKLTMDPQVDSFAHEDLAGQMASRGSGFYYTKVPTHRVAWLMTLGKVGFSVVDVNLLFEMPAAPTTASPSHPQLEVRAAVDGDTGPVLEIATKTFEYSRFHLDPAIPNETANRIKRDWIENCLNGTRGDGVLVGCLEGQVAGFLAMITSIEDGQTCRTIDLIGVSPACQRRGVGRGMIEAFLRMYSSDTDLFRVGTQVANTASVGLYEQSGFRLKQSTYVLHAHVFR